MGNRKAINSLYAFIKRWNKNRSKPGALLIGPAGSGKTSATHAIANELGYDVMELNASDARSKNSIRDIVSPASQYVSLENPSKKRIILMDEVDGISGRYDRGGLSQFLKIIKKSQYPIVCTANDPDSKKLDKLKRKLRVIKFTRLDEFDIFELLLKIVKQEDIDIDEKVLEKIAAKSAGDLRAAINELESHVYGDDVVQLEERDKMMTLTDLFNQLFLAKTPEEGRKIMQNAPSDYYKLLLYLFDEAAKQCKTPEEIATIYEQLAQADLVYQRIMQTQNWSLLKYFFQYIGPGIVISRPSRYHNEIKELENIPYSFKARGISKRVNSKANKLAPTIAPKLHTSEKYFIQNEFDLFKKIISGEHGAEIAAWLGLNDDEIKQLSRAIKSSNLKDKIEDARKRVGNYNLNEVKYEPREMKIDNFLRESFNDTSNKDKQHQSQRKKNDKETSDEIKKQTSEEKEKQVDEEKTDEEKGEGEKQSKLDDFF